jgi:hypothetical protein
MTGQLEYLARPDRVRRINAVQLGKVTKIRAIAEGDGVKGVTFDDGVCTHGRRTRRRRPGRNGSTGRLLNHDRAAGGHEKRSGGKYGPSHQSFHALEHNGVTKSFHTTPSEKIAVR